MISNIIALFQSCKFWLPSWSHTNFRVLIVVKSLCIIYILRFHCSGNAKGGNPGLKFGSAGWPASRAYDPRIRPVGSTDFEFFPKNQFSKFERGSLEMLSNVEKSDFGQVMGNLRPIQSSLQGGRQRKYRPCPSQWPTKPAAIPRVQSGWWLQMAFWMSTDRCRILPIDPDALTAEVT